MPELELRRHCAILAQHIATAERALAASSPQGRRLSLTSSSLGVAVADAATTGGAGSSPASAERRRQRHGHRRHLTRGHHPLAGVNTMDTPSSCATATPEEPLGPSNVAQARAWRAAQARLVTLRQEYLKVCWRKGGRNSAARDWG